MELTPRLRAIAQQVPQGSVLADVGTDHALLPAWLLLEGRIPAAIASDLREGPLSRAKETVEQHGVADRVSLRLCDGLSGIQAGEADVVAIAGMGGETIAAILEQAPWTRENTLLLLQPMTSFPDLRQWLVENGYRVEHETLCQEGSRMYTVLTVRGGQDVPMTPAELWVGRNTTQPLRGAYLSMMEGKVRRALDGQKASAHPDQAVVEQLEQVLAGICEMKKELEA